MRISNADNTVNIRWPSKFNEIPKEVFHREDVYRLELERIFMGPEWHMVAHRAELANPGDYKTFQIGEAPVLIVHGEDGKLRVFQNACPHRGTQLATCPRGSGRKIECPYHRWTFKNTGELAGIPGVADFPKDFRKEDYGLRELRSAEVYGIVFATFSADAPEIDEWLGETKPYIAHFLDGDGDLTLLGYQKVLFDSNWKEYGDNEGYHAPLLHVAARLLRFPKTRGEQFMTTHAHKVNLTELPEPGDAGFLRDPSVIMPFDATKRIQASVIQLYPISLILRNHDTITMRFVFPRSVDCTEVHYAYFGRREDSAELSSYRARQASNLLGPSGFISLEDGAVFNRIHVASRTPGTVAFQKGVTGPITAPITMDKGEEATNLIRWERYRQTMGFERA